MKTAISVPDDTFKAADTVAKRLGISRSELYATAVAEYVAKHRDAKVTERLDQVYAVDAGAMDPALTRAQRQSVEDLEW